MSKGRSARATPLVMSAAGDPKNPMNEPPAGGYGAPGPVAGFGPTAPPTPPKASSAAPVAALVVGGLVVAMVGTLAVLAIFGVRKYIGASKQAEVKNTLGQITKDALMGYEREHLPEGDASRSTISERRLCASATRPVPAGVSFIRGKKYQSSRADWDVDKARDAGFACLRFEMTSPQYYQYRYEATAESFVAGGRGDLDGDGVLSDFRLQGRVEGGRLLTSPQILETDPEE